MDNHNLGDALTIKLVLLGYSVVFLSLLTLGYYYLFAGFGGIAWLLAPFLPLIAWGIAKIIGSSSEGISGHIPLFALLLLVSAAGMFNALMLALEGPTIFKETITAADQRFAELQSTESKLTDDGTNWLGEVNNRKENLFREIRNANNCGYGDEAHKRFLELQKLLPDLRETTGAKSTCSKVVIDNLIAIYEDAITKQIGTAPNGVKSQVASELAQKIETDAANARAQLSSLTAYVNAGKRLLPDARLQLEELAHIYAADAGDAIRIKPTLKTSIAGELNLGSVASLGQWNQVFNLLVARADKLQTYFYLTFAIFADFMLIYQFRLARRRGSVVQQFAAPPVAPQPQRDDSIWS